MRVAGRTVAWPGADGQTFTGYRPFADAWGPDVLWMEGTLLMRFAKSRCRPTPVSSTARSAGGRR